MKRYGVIIAAIAIGFYIWIVSELIKQYNLSGCKTESLVAGLVFFGILIGILAMTVYESCKEIKERNNKPIYYRKDYE